MPPVIIPALAAVGVTGSIGGVAISSLIGEGVTLGGIVALGRVLNRTQRAATAGSMELTKQSLPPRVRVYGRVKIGGALYFQAAPNNLVKGIYFCDGPIDAFEQLWLGDYLTAYITGQVFSTAGVYPWYWAVQFYVQTGTIPQIRNAFLAQFDQWWNSKHTGNGLANVVMSCLIPYDPKNNFQKFYPSGVPALRAVLRGLRIFDPRDNTQSWTDPATWKYSENPGLCALDFLTSPRGYHIPNSRIDTVSFTAFANVCDQTVVRFDGATEPRYRCWGSYTLDDEPRTVLQAILLTCDGELYQEGTGKIGIRGGVFTSPSVTITQAMILGYEVQAGPDKISRFNRYRVSYTEPRTDFQLHDGFIFEDIAAQALDGGKIIPQNLSLPFVPSDWQAHRLAQIYMAQNNPAWMITVTATIAALDALGERIVTLTIGELGINDTFHVTKFDIAGDLKSCVIALSSLHASAYGVDPSHNDLGPGLPGLVTNATIPAVTSLVVTQANDTFNGAVITSLQVSAAPLTVSGYTFNAEVSGDTGVSYTGLTPNGVSSALSNVLGEGSYEVKAAWHLSLGSAGAADGAFTGPITIVLDDQRVGPIGVSLFNGQPVDFLLVTSAADTFDGFGMASTGSVLSIDLGLASA